MIPNMNQILNITEFNKNKPIKEKKKIPEIYTVIKKLDIKKSF